MGEIEAHWRIVAEHEDGETTPRVLYVHHAAGLDGRGTGSYLDQIICRERMVLFSGALGNIEPVGENPSPSAPANERLYYCQNRRADMVAIVSSSGRQVEQARYSSYGVPFGLPAGDADSDGDVDAADLSQIQSWIDASSYDVRGDSDLDGDVDSTDTFLANAISGTTLGRGVLTRNSTASRFGYAGYFYHQTVLKYHVRNRVYDPYLGRWITRDPIDSIGASMSLYEYVGNDPQLYVDPFGLLPPDAPWWPPQRYVPPNWDPYTGLPRPKKQPKRQWVKSPDDIGRIPGYQFGSWENRFRALRCLRGDAKVAVLSCHANAKDGPYYDDEDGTRHRLGDPDAWPQEWVDALQGYDEVILWCCYIGETDYGNRVAIRIGKPVYTPGKGPLYPEVWQPATAQRWPPWDPILPGTDPGDKIPFPSPSPYPWFPFR